MAERIHWLQGMRADEIAERTRWLDQRRFGQDDRLRDWDRNRLGDIREDRRELRDDQRRLPRDRQDLHRDLGDREDRGLHRGWGDHEDRGLHRGWNNDHRSNVPAPKNSRNSVPFGKGKGRGKG